MGHLVLALISVLVSIALLAVKEARGDRILWTVTLTMLGVAGGAAFIVARPPSETSAAALTVGIAMSLLLAAFVVSIGAVRFGRIATVALASALCMLSLAPGYMLGCVIADILPVNGCFF